MSGSAEMGVVGGDRDRNGTAAGGSGTQFWTHVDVTFTLSGSTDNGLTFGASVDLDEAGDAIDGSDGMDGIAVFLSGNFGTVTMGDTDGGFDWGMAEVPTGSGSIDDSETAHNGWNGNGGLDGTHDGQILRYDHSIGGLGFAVSVELDDTVGVEEGDSIIGFGLRYNLGDLGIGLGYQTGEDSGPAPRNDLTVMGISLAYSLGDIALGANYSVLEETGALDVTHIGLGASYSMDALTVGINWGEYEQGTDSMSGWGLSAGYDLGGGASIVFGYSNSSETGQPDVDSWSIGLSMGF